MKADLHCHSHFSDGKHTPEALVQRATEVGLTHLAITDHDYLHATSKLPASDSVQLISGVEISCQWENQEIHVVGLCLDVTDRSLNALLQRQQQARRERMAAMDAKLQKIGIVGLAEFVAQLPAQAVTRSHVADFLVTEGHSKSLQKAFKRYIGKRGKAYVPAQWHSLDDVVAAITMANGIAVLAHPGRYPLSKSKLDTLVKDFHQAGGEALETNYGNVDPDEQKRLQDLAIHHKLYMSQGSDFHDSAAHWTDLGKFPPLNTQAKKNAIWLHPRWHSS